MDPVNIQAKVEVRSFTHSWDNSANVNLGSLLDIDLQYLRNGARYDQGYYYGLTGTHTRAFDWYQNRWPWRAYPRSDPSFYICAIISGMSKATDFYFGLYIHRVHPNKRLLKIFRKRKRGRRPIQGQGLPKVFRYPLLSQERFKLRTSNSASTFTISQGSCEQKAVNNLWHAERIVGVSRGCRNFFS